MSKKLDLYLEKIIAKMNLDDAQRENVEREFRAHLEEAVREGVEKGLTWEQAETEAILSFGQPSVIARQFGITHGYVWFVFERICFSLVLYLTLSVFFNTRVLAFSIALLFLSRCLWNKIEINGTLRIRRFFRKTIKIPFEDIKKVTFEKGHLWGTRRIMLFFSRGRATLSPSLRNFRCAALALDVLCPDAFQPGVREFFQKISFRVRKERKWLKPVLIVYWLIILGGYSLCIPGIWNLEKISFGLPYIYIFVFLGMILHALHHSDKTKRGLIWILLIIYVLYLYFLILSLIHCTIYLPWLSLGFYPIIGGLLEILLWKGRRLHLFIMVMFTLFLFLPLRYIVPSKRGINAEEFISDDLGGGGGVLQLYWMNDTSFYMLTSDFGNTYNQLFTIDEFGLTSINLEDYRKGEGQWRITRKNTSSVPTLIYTPRYDYTGSSLKSDSAAFYLFSHENFMSPIEDLRGKFMTLIENLPDNMYLFWVNNFSLPVWSPDDRYLMTPVFDSDNLDNDTRWKQEHLAFTDVATSRVIAFEGVSSENPGGWIDNHTYELFLHSYHRENNEVKDTIIEIRRLHMDTGENELIRNLSFPGKGNIYEWTSGRYIPIVFEKTGKIGIIDLTTGKIVQEFVNPTIGKIEEIFHRFPRIQLKGINNYYSWCDNTGQLALVTQEGTKKYLIIADPGAVLNRFQLTPYEEILSIKYSPDGSKILLISYRSFGSSIPFFVHIEVFDLKREKKNILAYINDFGFIELSLYGPRNFYQQIEWSPDSRFIAYKANDYNFIDSHVNQNLHIVDYERWAEKNL